MRRLSSIAPVIVHRARWADEYIDGATRKAFTHDGKARYGWLDDYYPAAITAVPGGATTIVVSPALCYADAAHKWGLSDVHFCADYYRDFAQQLDDALGTLKG